MTIDSFKFRYINAQCYEFILPNGKHLLSVGTAKNNLFYGEQRGRM